METLAGVFKALSEPIRLQMVRLLMSTDEICVCDFTETMELPQSVISRHLAYLRRFGLVSARRQGNWMYYSICGDFRTRYGSVLDAVGQVCGPASFVPGHCPCD